MRDEKSTSQGDSTSIILVFGPGQEISKDLADRIVVQVEAMVQEMMPGVALTVKKICGKPFWTQLSKSGQTTAGKYIAYLVAKNQLPLTCVGKDHANHKRYQLK